MKTIAYTLHNRIMLPEVEIMIDKPEYVYVPLRGAAHVMVVYDINDGPIGWIRTDTLGYDSVKEYMSKTNWIDQGY